MSSRLVASSVDRGAETLLRERRSVLAASAHRYLADLRQLPALVAGSSEDSLFYLRACRPDGCDSVLSAIPARRDGS